MHFRVEGNPDEQNEVLRRERPVSDSADTIAAISTPAGEGAISLIRISGPDSVGVADAIFWGNTQPSECASHTQHFGHVREGDRLVDQVMLSVHRAPTSYTGEDLVEITCHGGVLVTAHVLECCLRAGARAARPGEFTERAFLNGKMDLTQAEAVIDLIRAKTDLALRSATEQLEGRLGECVRLIRDGLVSLTAHIEATIDFPEEGIGPDDNNRLRSRLGSIKTQITDLLNTADQGRLLREGVRVVIYGATNAGKSSLLNRMLGHDRVIVSETHGTTRDTIEEAVNLRGFAVRLIDTAGLRQASDQIEHEGIARTKRSLEQADVRLHVVDSSVAKSVEVDMVATGKELLVLNKCDLPEHSDWSGSNALRISCVTGEGLARLEQQIVATISGGHLNADNTLAINARHRECLRRAVDACEHARESLEQKVSPEYAAVDLKTALHAVGEIIGTVDVEQVLDSVFGQFCIGK
jgi:tRNA modification GTPase